MKLFLFLLFYPLSGFGQASIDRIDRSDEALQALSPEARAAVLQTPTALLHSTSNTSLGRVDEQTGIRRAIYRTEPLDAQAGSPEAAARAYLRRDHQSFGLSSTLEELRLEHIRESPAGYHVVFQQVVGDLPVYQGTVQINLDRELQPVSAYNDTYSHLIERSAGVDLSPAVTAERARTIVRQGISGTGASVDQPTLFVYPSDPARLVWKITAWPAEGGAEWGMLVDAHDGRFIHGYNAATRLHEASRSDAATEGSPEALERRAPLQTEGSGFVFDPDPLTTAGVTYGGAYIDDDDSNSDELSDQLFTVPLHDLTQRDGRYYLEGPYVQIVGINPRYFSGSSRDSINYTPPAETNPEDFRYTRAHEDFEAVNAYYHIDKSQRYLRSLDPAFTNLPEEPVAVNPHGERNDDNSFFYPGRNLISFGQGGVDDAEDAGVIWHEYGHVLLESAAPGLLNAGSCIEARSFHEGWGDYWIGSYRRSLAAARSGLSSADYDWREIFPWDSGSTLFWSGRKISHDGRYPSDLEGNCYRDGLLWAATLMDIFAALEGREGTLRTREILDRLNLQSHYLISPRPHSFTFRDAAVALVQADLMLYDGEHRSILLEHLEARGLIDPAMYGPQITFGSDGGTTYRDENLHIEVIAAAREFSVESVQVKHRRLGTVDPFETTILDPVNDSLYVGEISTANQPGLVEYYIEATDVLGISQSLPSAGPEQPFIAEIGNIAASNLLPEAWGTEDWRVTETGRRVEHAASGLAYLLFEPIDLAENPDVTTYAVLAHRYVLDEDAAGNVKISVDGGSSWNVVHPHADYPITNTSVPPLQGEPAFTERRDEENTLRSVFDLSRYAGQKIQLRLDFASAGEPNDNTFWQVSELKLYQATFDSQFTVSRELSLHPNYPNPFSGETTVHFTLPTAGSVTLELYDALGRRVRLLQRQTYSSGTHTTTINADGLADGIYFVRMTTPEGQQVRPIRVLR